MTRRTLLFAAIVACTLGAIALHQTILPSNWQLSPPRNAMVVIGTMPQGLSLSPDLTRLAVVEAGFNPPALRILSVPTLQTLELFPLKDAFGIPQWRDNNNVVVPGGQAGGVFVVNFTTKSVTAKSGAKWATALALSKDGIATVSDTDNNAILPNGKTVRLGSHPAAFLRLSDDYVAANRGESTIAFLSSREVPPGINNPDVSELPVDLHPSALLATPDGKRLYVACTDADAVDVVDVQMRRVIGRIDVGLPRGPGASPNGLALASDGTLYVSLGAENAVAEIRNGKVVARYPAGWYPTGVAVDAHNVYVTNGKGEGGHANPDFSGSGHNDKEYVAALLTGSVRSIERTAFTKASTRQVLANIPAAVAMPPVTVVRAHGPIEHIIYVIKENRTYDQVLGDIKGANGDAKLAWFGERVTPNQHAIARRFGIFDAAYADAQVSANGHNWSTAAFANDYLERFWPPEYGGRRTLYDFEDGAVASTPRNGYIWDEANRHNVSLRDYGEFVTYAPLGGGYVTTSTAGLRNKIDPKYPPFDMLVSDESRIDEWLREFNGYVANGNLPAFEIVRLPNDHTAGTRRLLPSPSAYVAQNDHALGRLVDAVSHSRYWAHTAIFAIEDDAQNGPDHVSDQRTTMYVASPYAATGVHHAHYSTTSLLRTIELMLGLHALSIYDAVAPPMYDAFTTKANLTPFDGIAPNISLTATNTGREYGSAISQRIDLRRADTLDDDVFNDILAHAVGNER
jgi:YVTN family beta-propeller protein